MSRKLVKTGLIVLVLVIVVATGLVLASRLFEKTVESAFLESLKNLPPGVELTWGTLDRNGSDFAFTALHYRDRESEYGLEARKATVSTGLLEGGLLTFCMEDGRLVRYLDGEGADAVPALEMMRIGSMCVDGVDPFGTLATAEGKDPGVRDPEYWRTAVIGKADIKNVTIVPLAPDGPPVIMEEAGFAGFSEGRVSGFYAKGITLGDPTFDGAHVVSIDMKAFSVGPDVLAFVENAGAIDDPFRALEPVSIEGLSLSGLVVADPASDQFFSIASLSLARLNKDLFGPLDIRGMTVREGPQPDSPLVFAADTMALGTVDLGRLRSDLARFDSRNMEFTSLFGVSSVVLDGLRFGGDLDGTTVGRLSLGDVQLSSGGALLGFSFEMDKGVFPAESLEDTPFAFFLENQDRSSLEASGKFAMRAPEDGAQVHVDPLRVDLKDIGSAELSLSLVSTLSPSQKIVGLPDILRGFRLADLSLALTGDRGTPQWLANRLIGGPPAPGMYGALVDQGLRPVLGEFLEPAEATRAGDNITAFLEHPGRLVLKVQAKGEPPSLARLFGGLDKSGLTTLYSITTSYSR
ncbi:hypothetical protein IHV25_02160 [Phaeovibrio sulfidiphilus]|uniref:Uncharacterized protein n=1 Tax=Phaeovibrio sulfidiphilus TaxID=1220600 RepID=A0A8J6YXG7_9PROT|nr:hypothetical protein [Phaeovibrio sulfidiphilus]MBE1236458.1 hypothetical protein [Phaeovibrio sulfidiphilus]